MASIPYNATPALQALEEQLLIHANNPSDSKEEKKAKRLVRNRLAAQAHRERKRVALESSTKLLAERNQECEELYKALNTLRRAYGASNLDPLLKAHHPQIYANLPTKPKSATVIGSGNKKRRRGDTGGYKASVANMLAVGTLGVMCIAALSLNNSTTTNGPLSSLVPTDHHSSVQAAAAADSLTRRRLELSSPPPAVALHPSATHQPYLINQLENTPELWTFEGENSCPWIFDTELPFYPPAFTPSSYEPQNLRGSAPTAAATSTALIAAPAGASSPSASPKETTSVLFAPYAKAHFSDGLVTASMNAIASDDGANRMVPLSAANPSSSSRRKTAGSTGQKFGEKEILHILLPSKSIVGGGDAAKKKATNHKWFGGDSYVDEDEEVDEEVDEVVDSWTELSCHVLSARTVFGVDFI
jgi:hypothetical protein